MDPIDYNQNNKVFIEILQHKICAKFHDIDLISEEVKEAVLKLFNNANENNNIMIYELNDFYVMFIFESRFRNESKKMYLYLNGYQALILRDIECPDFDSITKGSLIHTPLRAIPDNKGVSQEIMDDLYKMTPIQFNEKKCILEKINEIKNTLLLN